MNRRIDNYKLLRLNCFTEHTGSFYHKASVIETISAMARDPDDYGIRYGDIRYIDHRSKNTLDYVSKILNPRDIVINVTNLRVEEDWLIGDVCFLKGLGEEIFYGNMGGFRISPVTMTTMCLQFIPKDTPVFCNPWQVTKVVLGKELPIKKITSIVKFTVYFDHIDYGAASEGISYEES
jgi:hypothetical protein